MPVTVFLWWDEHTVPLGPRPFKREQLLLMKKDFSQKNEDYLITFLISFEQNKFIVTQNPKEAKALVSYVSDLLTLQK